MLAFSLGCREWNAAGGGVDEVGSRAPARYVAPSPVLCVLCSADVVRNPYNFRAMSQVHLRAKTIHTVARRGDTACPPGAFAHTRPSSPCLFFCCDANRFRGPSAGCPQVHLRAPPAEFAAGYIPTNLGRRRLRGMWRIVASASY